MSSSCEAGRVCCEPLWSSCCIGTFLESDFFRDLFQAVKIKPKVLQNRFYAESGYDKALRKFCRENGIAYQSFWTLTANLHLLDKPPIQSVVKRLSKELDKPVTPAQVWFKFCLDSQLYVLTGTTDSKHMTQDLEILNWPSLKEDELVSIESLLY
jgi:diketogulonate reductase-like aldo/keto reductase